MNQINNIYTTISNGQVHIAADTKYIGSVDSYNNSFTQFFAWLFKLSIAVDFDGKVRSLNKESYTNLLRILHQEERIRKISQAMLFRPIAEAGQLPVNGLKMRDVITRKDRYALFKKLAQAIWYGDIAKALLMIGKGAALNISYYDRDRLHPSFKQDTVDLDPHSRYSFTVFKAPPLLQAARKGHIVVCKFLQEAGANALAKGEKYKFKREITRVDKRLEAVVEPTVVPHHYIVKDQHGSDHHAVSQRLEYRPALRERTVVTTEDSRSGQKSYKLDPTNFRLIEEGNFEIPADAIV